MELMIPLKNQPGLPYYSQIYSYIKEEIKKGNIGPATRLPSTRQLAENIKVSRSTTQMAYEQLLSEGYIEAVPCKGYFVCRIESLVRTGQDQGDKISSFFSPSSVGRDKSGEWKVDFSPRGIDLCAFPFNTWRKISKNTLVDDNREMFMPGDPQGEPAFREAIRSYLHSARGVNCLAEQIIVGAGSEYLLMLLSQILGTERLIAMENPTYKQAYRVFRSLKYQVVPVAMDKSGMDVELLKKSGADIAYVMPSHQYPTGIVMPVKRRQELLAWAYEQEGRYLIEDDYDSEFRYKGKPIPALQGMDGRNRVIYYGTFSKSIAPAIRVSYMVLPAPLLAVYRERMNFYASTVSRIDQNILYEFMGEGHYERHLNRMRAVYKAKHDAMSVGLKPFESQFLITGEHAGLHLLLTDRKKRAESLLINMAATSGVKVYGMSGYFIQEEHNAYPSTVVLGYASLTEEEIRTGLALLCQAWSVCDQKEGSCE
ncbi:PLP-dependent aminotransferase family protein [Lacrimispora saccharolytica]|uniref:Transcriptional regulator, GntR family with aminotransferase domain n=1 Tax=Lacrimispora saccharolytica (strain ATCC 35040 / DSM 2544 / NRCC 2533 / WM1) TaxID=610130 RepID=D9R6V1_LACSW|nr:PLP-dependent aminotransferase family protein [Lacrimispora saccharolytica]ADL03607.1 transcriptional regulator, GntR family with aminotransferase domain [[Clostridium] saccharolyticum WM1]QRV18250.1 PLP-dependent aminotransferase family protein [Lacrimispora saccharolytica]